jgi:hypothetical protein
VVLTTHPLLALKSGNSTAIPLPALWAFGSVRGTFTFTRSVGIAAGVTRGKVINNIALKGKRCHLAHLRICERIIIK